MNTLNRQISTIGIYFSAAALLLMYLFAIRYNIFLPVAIFWVAITLMLSIILYQCLRLKLSPDYIKIILLEIVVTTLILHLIEQIPYYGLSDTDAYVDLISAKGILSSGFIRGDAAFINKTSYYPLIHILGVQLASITNIDLVAVAKWFPSFIDVAFVLILYLFIRSIFRDERIALLATLLTVCLQIQIVFGSQFVRQTIAMVLFVSCLYFYFSARSSSKPVIFILLSLLCLVGTIFAHHFTSFMLVIIILVHYLVIKITEISYIRRKYLNQEIVGEKITLSFVLIAIVALSGYWLYIVELLPPHLSLLSFVELLFQPSIWGGVTYSDVAGIKIVTETIRGTVLVWGNYIVLFFFGVVLLYGLIPRLRSSRIEALSFTIFLFLCGIAALFQLYIIPFGTGIFPDRFFVFGWLFGFAPLLFLLLTVVNSLFRRIGIILLLAYILLNIYSIDSSSWDVQSTDIPTAALEEDYALASTLDFSRDTIAGHSYALMAIYDVHNNRGSRISFTEGTDLSKYDWLVVQKELLRRNVAYLPNSITAAELSEYLQGTSSDWIKPYESNNLAVLKSASYNLSNFFEHIDRARINGTTTTKPIIPTGSSLDWDEHFREIGNVLYETLDSEKTYKTFYTGYKDKYKENNVYVGFAYSTDGSLWTKYGKIINRSLEDPYVLRVDDTYYLYAEDKAEIPFRNIRRFHSSDCINWTDDGIVLKPGANGWDSQDVSSPIVWRVTNMWYMLYEGREEGSDGKIGLAISNDGLHWRKDSSNPIFIGSGRSVDFDKDQVVPDDIVKIGVTYYLIYHGYNDYSGWSSGIAYSRDLLSWTRGVQPISLSSTVMIYSDNGDYIAHYLIDSSSGIYKGYLR